MRQGAAVAAVASSMHALSMYIWYAAAAAAATISPLARMRHSDGYCVAGIVYYVYILLCLHREESRIIFIPYLATSAQNIYPISIIYDIMSIQHASLCSNLSNLFANQDSFFNERKDDAISKSYIP